MIYDFLDPKTPLRQGDILCNIPMIHPPDLNEMLIINSDGEAKNECWSSELAKGQEHIIVVPVKPVWGIVATQDCDASRVPEIACFLVDEFNVVAKMKLNENNINKRISTITEHSRNNNKWFYLPADSTIGFDKPMAANFLRIFQLDRESLVDKLEIYRCGRLNDVAYEHYRECLSQHYRRYPYDEWYPLTKEEYDIYSNGKQEPIKPFPWHE